MYIANGKCIPVICWNDATNVCRGTLAEDVTIPSRVEVLNPAQVTGKANNDGLEDTMDHLVIC